MLSRHRLCESDRVVHEGVCLAASHHDCVGWRVNIDCQLTPLWNSALERACMLLLSGAAQNSMKVRYQHPRASPVVQSCSQDPREKSGGNLVSMSSSLHVSGTDTCKAARLSTTSASALMQAPAVQASHTVTREGWLTPGDCISDVLGAGCAAEPHAKQSKQECWTRHWSCVLHCAAPSRGSCSTSHPLRLHV